jgi:hypothetical protein
LDFAEIRKQKLKYIYKKGNFSQKKVLILIGRSVMNIQPTTSYNITMEAGKPKVSKKFFDRCKQAALDMLPSKTLNTSDQKLKSYKGKVDTLTHPAYNRAIMGASALILQPTIDGMNRSVDKETRKVSVCRTIAKIIAGTAVGILVRGSSHELIKKFTDIKGTAKYSKALIPKDILKKYLTNESKLNNYRSTLSTTLAILAMCITNFVLDAPLSAYLTNRFREWSTPDKKHCEVKHE